MGIFKGMEAEGGGDHDLVGGALLFVDDDPYQDNGDGQWKCVMRPHSGPTDCEWEVVKGWAGELISTDYHFFPWTATIKGAINLRLGHIVD